MAKRNLVTRVRTLTPEYLYRAGLDGGIKDKIFSLVPSLDDKLISAYYRGLKERISTEEAPFERAFLLLINYKGFIPRPSIQQMPGFEIIYQEEHRNLIIKHEGVVRGHKIYSKRQELNGIDSARGIFDLAGAYVLYELDKRRRKDKADDNATIIRNFKLYIDDVIERLKHKKVSISWHETPGRLEFMDNPKGFRKVVEAAGDPIKLLEAVSENVEKFVTRYASLHGYRIRIN